MLRDESNTGGSRKRQRIRGRGVFCFCGKREEDLKKTKNQELRQSPSEACASWTVEAVNRQESLEFFAWAAPLIGKTVYHTGCCFLSMVNSRGLRASALLSIVSLDNNNNNNKLSWRLLQRDPGLLFLLRHALLCRFMNECEIITQKKMQKPRAPSSLSYFSKPAGSSSFLNNPQQSAGLFKNLRLQKYLPHYAINQHLAHFYSI